MRGLSALRALAGRGLRLSLLIGACAVAACSNGRGSVEETGEQTDAGFTVGGAVSGLEGAGLTLQLNGASDLAVAANGAFTFAGSLADGAAYDVTIRTQPGSPAQTCEVSSGAGRIAGADVTNVAVVCTTGSTAFAVGGAVTGLTGSGLVLRNNGAEDLPISSDGEFIFPTAVATGASYSVVVAQQPSNPSQTCSVEDGSGVMRFSDVTSVQVICSTSAFTIGGSVTGLAGLGLRLTNNGESLAIGADGQFAFRDPVASGATYDVKVEAHPAGQNCVVANGSGAVGNANVENVAVTCASDVYTIGGSIDQLAPGAEVVLLLDASGQQSTLTARRNGPFAFERSLTNGVGYVVRVEKQPERPAQECAVANAAGIVNGANVTNIMVTCTTRRFTIGGSVEGLQGAGLVLRLNGGNDLAIAGGGSFVFETPIESGKSYEVTVAANPTTPPQTCTVERGSGTVGAANVRNVVVRCALNTYPIGGTVSGLAPGARVVLENNGGDPVEAAADGAFTFPTPVATGGQYNVSVRTQPVNQNCSVANATGTVGSEPVTNVAVTCVSAYAVGGTVTGLAGPGLVLRNGEESLTIGADGAFTFATRLLSGATYNVEVVSSPTSPSQTCVVANGAGTIGNADVTNVSVTCTTNTFTVGGAVSGLLGFGLTLQLSDGQSLPIVANGQFTFPVALPSGSAYTVVIASLPIHSFPPKQQQCTISDSTPEGENPSDNAVSGIIGAANVADVLVTCQ